MKGAFLFDNNKTLIKSIQSLEMLENTQEMELNGLITASISFKYMEEIEDAAYFGVKDSNTFWLYKIRGLTKENDSIKFNGVHILFDDLKGRLVEEMRPSGVTISIVMSRILENTGWTLGIVQSNSVASSSYYSQSTLSAFADAIEKWDVEFEPRLTFVDGIIVKKEIDIYDRLSKDYGRWFEYGDKLISVTAETSTDDLFTAFMGRGKGEQIEGTGGFGRKITFKDIEWSKSKGDPVDKPKGQSFVELPSATKEFGYNGLVPKIGIIDFSDIEDKSELLERTYKYLVENARPKIQFKGSGLAAKDIELGETCAVIHSDMNIRYKTRVFKVKRDFLNEEVIQFEFGDKVVLSVAQRQKDEDKKNEAVQKENDDRFEKTLEKINESYFNGDGHNYELKSGNPYGLPAGYYSFDKPIDMNPEEVIGMSAGKLVIANKKDATGQWEFRTFGTGNGFVADEITAGTLNGNLLQAGTVLAEAISVNAKQDIREGLAKTADLEVTSERLSFEIDERKLGEEYLRAEMVQTVTDFSLQFQKEIELQGGEIEKINSYFDFNIDGFEIGKGTSDFSILQTNDGIYLNHKGVPISSWRIVEGVPQMDVTALIVLERIIMGNHVIMKHKNQDELKSGTLWQHMRKMG
ncbi:phage tail spike protein [Erysipelothrix aquatica]|uniref:phage tail spike protein n=1 Tax=Erysipelothrix aquatica TaxID=2683714 RepID=UPI00135A405F|nr:phage tail spike protein [Erysipelothrix aquatica]